LKQKIRNKRSDINKRICERAANPDNLPYYPPYLGAPPRRSVQGHEDIKDSLKDDEALYEAKCGGGGGDGGTGTAPVTPDTPQTRTSNVPGWAKVLGGAIIIGGGCLRPCRAMRLNCSGCWWLWRSRRCRLSIIEQQAVECAEVLAIPHVCTKQH